MSRLAVIVAIAAVATSFGGAQTMVAQTVLMARDHGSIIYIVYI